MNFEDERAIVAVLLRYATAIDRRDWQLFATCFTADVEADYGRIGNWHGRAALVDFMAQGHAKVGPTLHRITNVVITGEGDAAAAASYVDAILMDVPPGKLFRRAHGWYEDNLVRQDREWRIRRRRFVAVLIRESADTPS